MDWNEPMRPGYPRPAYSGGWSAGESRWDPKTAAEMRPHLLIVGGTKGIGRVLVEGLASTHFVSVIGRRETAMQGDAWLWRTDVTDSAALQRTLPEIEAQHGSVSAMILSQRYRGDGDEWIGEFATSLSATKQLLEWAADHLEDRGHGKAVVILTSTAASFIEEEQPASYHVAKAALTQMMRYYAVTLGPRQIRVNAVAPGLTIKDEAREFYYQHPQLEALYRDSTPLGRLGTAKDIAHLMQFLISDKAMYITGQTIVLDGGISLRSHWALARRVTPSLRDVQVTQRKHT